MQASAGVTFSIVRTQSGKGEFKFLPLLLVTQSAFQYSPLAAPKKASSGTELPESALPRGTKRRTTLKSNLVRLLHCVFCRFLFLNSIVSLHQRTER